MYVKHSRQQLLYEILKFLLHASVSAAVHESQKEEQALRGELRKQNIPSNHLQSVSTAEGISYCLSHSGLVHVSSLSLISVEGPKKKSLSFKTWNICDRITYANYRANNILTF